MTFTNTIKISQKLYRKIRARLEELGFSSVDECIEFVMNEFISEEEENTEQGISEDEEARIKKRLQSLGYLG
jgi:hypothetical protein